MAGAPAFAGRQVARKAATPALFLVNPINVRASGQHPGVSLQLVPTNMQAPIEVGTPRVQRSRDGSVLVYFKVGLKPVESKRSRPTPLTEPTSVLNLSVRSRNALARLGIGTLETLVAHSRDDLLETKNFGQTSLGEVEARLMDHGHRLRNFEATPLDQPVSVLNLTTRSRNGLSRLGIETLAELAAHSREQLLETRNFADVSADEVEQKFFQHGHRLQK